jgi:hypothetical protein
MQHNSNYLEAPGVPQVNEGSTPKPESRYRALREPVGWDRWAAAQGFKALSKLPSRRSQQEAAGCELAE